MLDPADATDAIPRRLSATYRTAQPSCTAERSRFSRFINRFDARSAAILLSTGGALPLPAIPFFEPTFVREGSLPLLGLVWLFTAVTFLVTCLTGAISDRQFLVLGAGGMIGIAVASWLVVDASSSRAVLTLLLAIPAIAAMASSKAVVRGFCALALALAGVVTVTTATSVLAGALEFGVTATVLLVPVFMVAALRRSLEISLRKYEALADTDPLTGLYNRRGFLRQSPTVFEAAASDSTHLACLVIDIDNFKSVNDNAGHAAGDAVLVEAVDAIAAAAPPNALLGRFGGEEFVILSALQENHQISEVADRIRCAVSATSSVTVSVGAVTAPVSVESSTRAPDPEAVLDELMRRADEWLYAAKAAGRDRALCSALPPVRVSIE